MMRKAFTLMELLIVVTIIMVLAGLLFPAFNMIRTQANTVKCMNNLRQIALAMEVYRQNHDETFPGYLNELVAEGFTAKSFLCPLDKTHGADPHMGRQPPGGPGGWGDYTRLHENGSSYCYEASGKKDATLFTANDRDYFYRDQLAADRPAIGTVGWADGKSHQQKFGNLKDPSKGTPGSPDPARYGNPFSASNVPIVRCYWHAPWANVTNAAGRTMKKVNNISFDFNTFWSTPYWELDVTPNLDP